MLRGRAVHCLSVLFLVVALGGTAAADPCLVVYPDGYCVYHYESAEYYTVGPGHPLYDAAYDRGGEVLIDANTNEIALNVYQAPGLQGFVLDEVNQGYFLMDHVFDLVVDGFNNAPIIYANILLVFDVDPAYCVPTITVDGNPVLFDPGLGYYYPIGDLNVATPTPDGNNYSDTVTHTISWDLCLGVAIWAFSDADYNLVHDGAECFTAFSHDASVPTESTTWGGIKILYSE